MITPRASTPPGGNDPIDRTLRALAGTQPPPDLNHRLLAALETHAIADTAPSGLRSLLAALRLPACALGLALAVLLSLRLLSPRTPHPSAVTTQQLAKSPQSTPTQAPQPLTALSLLAQPHPKTLAPAPVFRLATTNAPVAVPNPRPDPPLDPRLDPHLDLDQQALADFHAPSQLAPPLPLTAQERLVRLMLRRGERQDLAELDPAERAAFAQQQSREFNRFFDPPPPPVEIGIANRIHAPEAVSLQQLREIEAAQGATRPVPSSAPPATTPSGDPK